MSNLKNEEVKNEKQNAITGVGDVVHWVAKVSGLESLVSEVAGDDCGCKERRRKLNEMFPFKK